MRQRIVLAMILAIIGTACSVAGGGAGSGVPEPVPVTLSSSPSSLVLGGDTVPDADEPPEENAPDEDAPEEDDDAPDDGRFDNHTVETLPSVAAFEALAADGVGSQSVVKFVITDFSGNPATQFADASFYELHDEWYWFQLLNGQPAPASATAPVTGIGPFATIDEIYAWAEAQPRDELPLDLRFTSDGRLYSSEFYSLGLDVEPRHYGLGSIVRVRSDAEPDRWMIELEFVDTPDVAVVEGFFDALLPSLPPEIADQLAWVVRSPEQEIVGATIEAGGGRYADRVVRYDDFVEPGAISVYNPGVAAGRLLLIADGEGSLEAASPTDIVLVEGPPDFLPPAAALITDDPQTPLAHVNLLARNRGIPNASLAGLFDNAEIRQLARVRARVAVRATADGQLDIRPLTDAEFAGWQDRSDHQPAVLDPVASDGLPILVDLSGEASASPTAAEMAQLTREVGGKASGMVALLVETDAAADVDTPDRPLALTVRPYREHLALLADEVDAMFADRDFVASARARYLVLEGRDDFDDAYETRGDQAFAESFTAARAGSTIGRIVEAGGFKSMFRDLPIDPATLREIEDGVEAAYPNHAVTQGVRFRSSSTVEDIEGFNGAGLYDSNTGFLEPAEQIEEKDRDRSTEWAIKKTWASYWGAEAFEERVLQGIDHRSGDMGVLVHARFDDPLELSNAVLTFTVVPGPAATGTNRGADRFEMIVNAQAGDVSVANPESGDLPEIVVVSQDRTGATLRIERVASSTLVLDGEVLDRNQLRALFEQARRVTLAWRDRANAARDPERRSRTLTLDFEVKWMDEGWPARDNGPVEPSRLVLKQARSLEPGLRHLPADIADLPIPIDVLSRARLVESVRCDGAVGYAVLTDAFVSPDLGHTVDPYLTNLGVGDATNCERVVLYSSPDEYLIGLFDR